MKQVKTEAVSTKAIMTQRAFRAGFTDYKAGENNFDKFIHTSDQFCYEWGRFFAILAPEVKTRDLIPNPKTGDLRRSVKQKFMHLYWSGAFI